MKQILQNLKTGKVEVVEIPVPAVKAGHLLIRTIKSLISPGTERMLLEFGKANWIDKARQQPDKVTQVFQKITTDGLLPTINAVRNKLDQPISLGYSNVGLVKEVGKGILNFNVGDRVVSNGPHAEVVCIPEHLCARIPDGIDDATASFTVLSSIALQGIRLLKPTLGESIAVIGLGLIGLLACQILRANGCRVIGFDFDKRKIELAKKFGAEAYNLSEDIDPVHTAINFSRGYGVDAVLITASTKSNDPIQQAPKMCRKRGRVVLIGVVGLELSRDEFYKKEISFQVSCSYGPGRYETNYEKKGFDYPIGYVRWTEQRNFEAVLQLMSDEQIKTSELISDVIPITEAKKAYDALNIKKDVLGIILDYENDVDFTQRSIKLLNLPAIKATSTEPVIGFIGAGSFASSILIPAFKKCNVRLKTIVSSLGVSSFHAGNKYGFENNATDYNIILNDPEINTVVIATQHNTHARFVMETMKSGKHVFVEKPLCINEEELKEITDIYSSLITQHLSPPFLMVGFNRRFAPLVQKAKKLIDTLNDPKCFIMTVNAGMIPREHWTQDIEIGGGRIIGEGCHYIDLIRYLAGYHIESVQSVQMGIEKGFNVTSDKVSISLKFKDGSLGIIHYFANGHKSFPKERLEIFCAGKILQLDNFRMLKGYGWKEFKTEKLWTQKKGHQECVNKFVHAIRNGEAQPIPLDEIFEVTEATFQAVGLRSNDKSIIFFS